MSKKTSILLAALGTRGDIQPFINLGAELIALGYEVTIASDLLFKTRILTSSLGFGALGKFGKRDFESIGRKMATRHSLPDRENIFVQELFLSRLKELGKSLVRLVDQNDFSILSPSVSHILDAALEKQRRVLTKPFALLRAVPSPEEMWVPPDRLAASLKLKILGYPHWADKSHKLHRAHGWIHSGFLVGTQPKLHLPQRVQKFLSGGQRPVFISTGSVLDLDRKAFSSRMLEGIQRSGHRAIVQGDWPIRSCNSTVLKVGEISHRALLPHVAAAIHHGGAGITAETFLAGKNCAVIPHIFDGFFWADALERAGISAGTLPSAQIEASKFARLIRKSVTHPSNPRFKEKINADPGICGTATLLHRTINTL